MRALIGVIATTFVLAIGFAVLAAFLFLNHDLRGWPPTTDSSPLSPIEATLPDAKPFSIADCLPNAVDLYDTPTPEEYSGTATVTVLSCRSRSSAAAFGLSYAALAMIVLSLVIWRAVRRRRAAL